MNSYRLFLELPDGSGDHLRRLDQRIVDAIEQRVPNAVVSRISWRDRQFVVVEVIALNDTVITQLALDWKKRFRSDAIRLVTIPCTVTTL